MANYDDSRFEVMKTAKDSDGQPFSYWERLPFNPVLYGWEFKSACCCNIIFNRNGSKLAVTDKGFTLVTTGDKTISFKTPENQIEFLILDYGTQSDTFVSGAEPVEATHSH